MCLGGLGLGLGVRGLSGTGKKEGDNKHVELRVFLHVAAATAKLLRRTSVSKDCGFRFETKEEEVWLGGD